MPECTRAAELGGWRSVSFLVLNGLGQTSAAGWAWPPPAFPRRRPPAGNGRCRSCSGQTRRSSCSYCVNVTFNGGRMCLFCGGVDFRVGLFFLKCFDREIVNDENTRRFGVNEENKVLEIFFQRKLGIVGLSDNVRHTIG